jgi:hypothetical protein
LGASSGRKEPLWADVVSGRRFAIAEMDGFHRNRWTNWIGLSGRVQSEWVDALDRNGWTISGGIIISKRWSLRETGPRAGCGKTACPVR